MNNLFIFDLNAFYIFHFLKRIFQKSRQQWNSPTIAVGIPTEISLTKAAGFTYYNQSFLSSGFPENSPLGNTERSKFTGMKVYTPEFLGQGRIKPQEEIKINFRGLRLFNKRQ